MPSLKPCPFCGSDKHIQVWDGLEGEMDNNFNFDEDDFNQDKFQTIVCNVNTGGCGASGGYAPDEDAAVAKWNEKKP